MLPTFTLGPWQIGTYQLMISLAVGVASIWSLRRLLDLDRPVGIIIRGILLSAAAGFAGAFAASALATSWRVARSGILARPEGLSVIWGVISLFLAVALYCRWQRTSLGRALDRAAPPMFLGQAIGRLGCTAAGCCYGRPTDSWLGMYLPDENGFWAMRYPTQPLSVVADLLICLILLAVERYIWRRTGERWGWPFDGFLILLGIGLFSLKRFGMAFLRQSGTFPMVGALSWMHLNALIGLVLAIALIAWNLHRQSLIRQMALQSHQAKRQAP